MYQEDRAAEVRANQQFADAAAAREVLPPSKIPSFEGHVVHGTKIKLAGASNVDFADEVLHMDDTVKLEVYGQVTRVDYAVNATTGQLFRVHTVKVADVSLLLNGDE